MRQRRRSVLPLALAMLATIALVAPTVSAADLNESKGFRKAVTLAGIREHQAAFQAFSNANGGNRVAGSPGYVASRDYVARKWRRPATTSRCSRSSSCSTPTGPRQRCGRRARRRPPTWTARTTRR